MVYRTTREFFTHGNVTITGEGLQILTYARHSWPLSSEGLDRGHPFTMGAHTYRRAFSSGTVTTCFYGLGLSRLGFEHQTFRLRGQHSNPLRHRRGNNSLSQCKRSAKDIPKHFYQPVCLLALGDPGDPCHLNFPACLWVHAHLCIQLGQVAPIGMI